MKKRKFHLLSRPFFVLADQTSQVSDPEMVFESVHLHEVKYLSGLNPRLKSQLLPIHPSLRRTRIKSTRPGIRPILRKPAMEELEA